jgi:hypothetical protein
MVHHPPPLLILLICQILLFQIPHPQATQVQHPIKDQPGLAQTSYTSVVSSSISRQWIRPTQKKRAGALVSSSKSGTRIEAHTGWTVFSSARTATSSRETWRELPQKAGASLYTTVKTTSQTLTEKAPTNLNQKYTKTLTCNVEQPRPQELVKGRITAQ